MGPAKIYFIIFGILTIAGGIVGYVKAGSLPSIIAGSITGVLLLIAGSLLPEHRAAGLATGVDRAEHAGQRRQPYQYRERGHGPRLLTTGAGSRSRRR